MSGYPATVGHYSVDVVPTKTVTNNYSRACMFAIFDLEGHLVCYCTERAIADAIALKLTIADQAEYAVRQIMDIPDEAPTLMLPRAWVINPPPPLPELPRRELLAIAQADDDTE